MTEQPTFDSNATCERCGRYGAHRFGDHLLCESCYAASGSCCPEFGQDDLWAPGVRHNRERSRFEIVGDEGTSVLDYVLDGRTAIFMHTEVPPALRGRGLAEDLVRAALGWAEDQKLHVEPRCSYVARFIERHPEFSHLLARV